jgi:hypothetical protein
LLLCWRPALHVAVRVVFHRHNSVTAKQRVQNLWEIYLTRVRSLFTSAQFGQIVGRCSRRVGSIHSASVRFKAVLSRKHIIRNIKENQIFFFCYRSTRLSSNQLEQSFKRTKGDTWLLHWVHFSYIFREFSRRRSVLSWYAERPSSHLKFKLNSVSKSDLMWEKQAVRNLIKYYHEVTIKLPANENTIFADVLLSTVHYFQFMQFGIIWFYGHVDQGIVVQIPAGIYLRPQMKRGEDTYSVGPLRQS